MRLVAKWLEEADGEDGVKAALNMDCVLSIDTDCWDYYNGYYVDVILFPCVVGILAKLKILSLSL